MTFRVTTLLLVAALASGAFAQQTRVNVIIENLAPGKGTSLTPPWIGFHNGTFDSYDGGTPADTLPIPGSDALERLAEDGNTGPISRDFVIVGAGTKDATLPGPNGPLGPGDKTMRTFLLNNLSPLDRYFSYASMILPSNDAFVANGNPLAHPIFDAQGQFIGEDFFVFGQNQANDAGTEVNDELPQNTAFFGQMAPDTGVDEGGVITTHPGFFARTAGGILADSRFRNGDFTVTGYPFMRVSFRAAPAVTGPRGFAALLDGASEVPPVSTPAFGIIALSLLNEGETLAFTLVTLNLDNLVMGHLHLGAAGTNGPVVASLFPPMAPGGGSSGLNVITGTIQTSDLTGPTADFPLDEIVRLVDLGQIYVNIHTNDGQPGENTGPGDFASGELRGQLANL